MMIERIVLLPGSSFAQRVTAQGAQRITARESLHFDALRAALAECLDMSVAVHDSPGVIKDGDFFICPLDALENLLASVERPQALPRRCLVVGVTRNAALEQAESVGLAGVVDSAVYSQWQINYPHAEVALFGLRALLPWINGTASPSPRERGPHYQRIVARARNTLPGFMAEYIQAFQQM